MRERERVGGGECTASETTGINNVADLVNRKK